MDPFLGADLLKFKTNLDKQKLKMDASIKYGNLEPASILLSMWDKIRLFYIFKSLYINLHLKFLFIIVATFQLNTTQGTDWVSIIKTKSWYVLNQCE